MKLMAVAIAVALGAAGPALAEGAFGNVTPINPPMFDPSLPYRRAQEIELQRQQIEMQQMELERRQAERNRAQAVPQVYYCRLPSGQFVVCRPGPAP